MNKLKTLADISKVLNTGESGTAENLGKYFRGIGKEGLKEIKLQLKSIDKMYKTEKDRLAVYEKLLRIAKIHAKDEYHVLNILSKQYKKYKDIVEQKERIDKLSKAYVKTMKQDAGKALDMVIKKNKEIYEISHDLQLQGNATWNQFTKLYSQAYDVSRAMNKELGKQLLTAGEIVKAQNAMVQAGWRDINTSALTSLSAQASLITRTLGQFPIELQQAFQMSFRQFGSLTDTFINSMGNSLNEFSNTFGMTVNMLSQTVANMMAANTFLARNNLNAQLSANQSLMQAVALTSRVGINTPSFIPNLANTAQFGTASQMAEMYQAGAYLNDFSTSDFQEQMTDQNYAGATENLIGSIYDTLNGMDSGYLKNEYMAQIGSGFGLSQDDILQIMTNGNDLTKYSSEVQDKLLDVNTSMEDELKDLHMTLVQQIENFWVNSKFSEIVGSFLQETGLYGMNKLISATNVILLAQLSLQSMGNGTSVGGNALNLLKGKGGVGLAGIGKTAGMGLGGLAIGVGGNILGSNRISNNTDNNLGTDIGGGALNILSGAVGGAMIGSAGGIIGTLAGGIIGAAAGGISTLSALEEKNSKIEQLDIQERDARRAAQTVVSSGDPVVDAINIMNEDLKNAISGGVSENKTLQVYLANINKNTLSNVSK